MKKQALLIIATLITATFLYAKSDEKYNPLRPDGAFKKVKITVEWDNPDIPKANRERLAKELEINIETSAHEAWISRGRQKGLLERNEYLELWLVFKKNKLWELDSNALTDPRPIGVPQRTFILKMEGVGEKYFAVDAKNKRNKKHLLILDAIDGLVKKKLGV